MGGTLSITRGDVTEIVKQLSSTQVEGALGVNEIRPEFLNPLDVVGLSRLTHPCTEIWHDPSGLADHWMVSLFKKVEQRVYFN